MNERRTNDPEPEESPKTAPRAEAPDTQGMGAKRQRSRNGPKVSSSSSHAVPMEKSHGARGSDLFKGHPAESGSGDEAIKNRESKTQANGDSVEPGIDAFKKKDA